MKTILRRLLLIGSLFFLVGGVCWASNGGSVLEGLFVIAPAGVVLAWVGSMEWRLRSFNNVKVNQKYCDEFRGVMKGQMDRMESHIYDLLKAQGVEPSREPPEEIKNH